MKRKSRKQKADEYTAKFGHIPIDYRERLSWLYDKLHITEREAYDILDIHRSMISSLNYYTVSIVLFEIPEGSPRPRMRIVNRQNLSNMALSNSNFIHVYSLTGHEDQIFMKRLLTEQEFEGLNQIICTPCDVDINAYLKTPSSYNRRETILAEVGLQRPITKPDWDNIAKKYCDMFNYNIWMDDTLVIDGSVHKYYSILPRVEIKLRYLNCVYTKNFYNSIMSRKGIDYNLDLHYLDNKGELV